MWTDRVTSSFSKSLKSQRNMPWRLVLKHCHIGPQRVSVRCCRQLFLLFPFVDIILVRCGVCQDVVSLVLEFTKVITRCPRRNHKVRSRNDYFIRPFKPHLYSLLEFLKNTINLILQAQSSHRCNDTVLPVTEIRWRSHVSHRITHRRSQSSVATFVSWMLSCSGVVWWLLADLLIKSQITSQASSL